MCLVHRVGRHQRQLWLRLWKSASERVLQPLPQLRLLLRRVLGVLHRPTTFGQPAFEHVDRPAISTLQRAETQYGTAVVGVFLGVPHQLQCHRPRPRHSDEGESTLAEDRKRRGGLMLCCIVEDGVVVVVVLAVCVCLL